jgi:hypothetical protein
MKTKPDLPDIVEPPCWRMSPPSDFCEFLRQLPDFVPTGSVLCLESGGAFDVEAYVLERPATYENETDQGFWKFRPKILYMPITQEHLHGLAELCEKHAEPEVGNTLSVYWNDQIILSWHDLPVDPIYLSDALEEAVLRDACDILGCGPLIHAATEEELLVAERAVLRRRANLPQRP